MAWFKVDDQFHAHRKVRRLLRSGDKHRDAASLGLWVLAGAWVSQNKTGGFIPLEVLEEWDDDAEKLAERLVHAGLWWNTERNGDPGYGFNDWGATNASAESIEANNASASGARGNHVRWHEKRGRTVEGCPFCYPGDRGDIGGESGANRPDDLSDSSGGNRPESGGDGPDADPNRPDADPISPRSDPMDKATLQTAGESGLSGTRSSGTGSETVSVTETVSKRSSSACVSNADARTAATTFSNGTPIPEEQPRPAWDTDGSSALATVHQLRPEPPAHVETGSAPARIHAGSSAASAVALHVPKSLGISSATRRDLAEQAQKLMNDPNVHGPDIETALQAWAKRSDAGPGLLRYLVDDAARSRAGGQTRTTATRPEHKTRTYANLINELEHETVNTRTELE